MNSILMIGQGGLPALFSPTGVFEALDVTKLETAVLSLPSIMPFQPFSFTAQAVRFAHEVPLHLILRRSSSDAAFVQCGLGSPKEKVGLLASAGGGHWARTKGVGLRFKGIGYQSYKTTFNTNLLNRFANDERISKYLVEAKAEEERVGEEASTRSDKKTLLFRAIWLRLASLANGIPEKARELFLSSEELYYYASEKGGTKSDSYIEAERQMLSALELVADDRSSTNITGDGNQFILIVGRRGRKRDERTGGTSIEAWFLPYRSIGHDIIVLDIPLKDFIASAKNRNIQGEEVEYIAQKFGNSKAIAMLKEAGDAFNRAYSFADKGMTIIEHLYMVVGHAMVQLAITYLYESTGEYNEVIGAMEKIVQRLKSASSKEFHAVAIEWDILIQSLFGNEKAVEALEIVLGLERKIFGLNGKLRYELISASKRVRTIVDALSRGEVPSDDDMKFLTEAKNKATSSLQP